MSRTDAIANAHQLIASGEFLKILDRRVGYKTESQNAVRAGELRAYLEKEMQPAFAELDFESRLVESPSGKSPFLVAEHREGASLPTVLIYGHGDVVDGMAGEWRDGLDPFKTTRIDNRVYGRGTADNKGQHSINLAALRAVRDARGGKLGFNAKFLVEMGEEIGSPPIVRLFSSVAAAASAFTSMWSCAKVGTIPAIGAACSPTPPPSLRMRSHRSSTAMGE